MGNYINKHYEKILDVERKVCTHFKLTLDDLHKKYRGDVVKTPRQIVQYYCLRHLGVDPSSLAAHFGQHHATILHSIRTIEDGIDGNKHFREKVNNVILVLTNE